MLSFIRSYKLFFVGVFLGITLWICTYMVLPVEATERLKFKTIFFILTCYISLFLGFISKRFKTHKSVPQFDYKFFKCFTIFICICFLLRWVDLFILREISFNNHAIINRGINKTYSQQSNVLFIVVSVLKSLYFFPFVIMLKKRYPINLYTVSAIVVLTFPLIEALLFGTRKPFFEIFLIVLFSIIFIKKPKFGAKNITLFIVSVITLLTISYNVLLNREKVRNQSVSVYETIIKGRYNEILKPKKSIADFFLSDSTASIKKNYGLILLQTGQYINHGVFEFNHIIDNDKLLVTNGKYSFSPFFKLLSKIGFLNDYKSINPSPRKHVYLSSFGSFYIDFRWLTVILFFLLGVFQRYVYDISFYSIIHYPLIIYLTIINVFLPILNYIKGAGIYPIVGFIFVLILYNYLLKKINEKSAST